MNRNLFLPERKRGHHNQRALENDQSSCEEDEERKSENSHEGEDNQLSNQTIQNIEAQHNIQEDRVCRVCRESLR